MTKIICEDNMGNKVLSFLEPIFLSFIKQVRLRTSQVDNLRTPVSLKEKKKKKVTKRESIHFMQLSTDFRVCLFGWLVGWFLNILVNN